MDAAAPEASPQAEAESDSGKSNRGNNINDYDDPMDCPCVQEILKGPCGDTFAVAFKCFIDSTEETKGMDCVQQFMAMQQCFTEHPDVYGQYLQAFEGDDEEDDEAAAPMKEDSQAAAPVSPASPAEGQAPSTPSAAPEKEATSYGP